MEETNENNGLRDIIHQVKGRDIKELNKELYTYSSQVALQSYISPLTNPSRDEDISNIEDKLQEVLVKLLSSTERLEDVSKILPEAFYKAQGVTHEADVGSTEPLPFTKSPLAYAVNEAISSDNVQEASPSHHSSAYAVLSHPSNPSNLSNPNNLSSYNHSTDNTARNVEVASVSNASSVSPVSPTSFNTTDITNDAPPALSNINEPASLLHERESSLRESLGESHAQELLEGSSSSSSLKESIVEAIEEGFEKVASSVEDQGATGSPSTSGTPSSGSPNTNIEALTRNLLRGNGTAVLGNMVTGGVARLLSVASTAVPAAMAGFVRGGVQGGLFAGAASLAVREGYSELAQEQGYAEKFGSNFYEMRANTSAMREAGALANDAQSDFESIRSAKAGMSVGNFSLATQMVSGSRGAIDYSDIEQYGDNPAELLSVTVERMKSQGYTEDQIVGSAQLMGFESLPSMAEGWTEGTREQIQQKIEQAEGRDEEAERAGSLASAFVENTDAVRIAKDAMLDVAARSSELLEPINESIKSNDTVAKNLDDLGEEIAKFEGAVRDLLKELNPESNPEPTPNPESEEEGFLSSLKKDYESSNIWLRENLIIPINEDLEAAGLPTLPLGSTSSKVIPASSASSASSSTDESNTPSSLISQREGYLGINYGWSKDKPNALSVERTAKGRTGGGKKVWTEKGRNADGSISKIPSSQVEMLPEGASYMDLVRDHDDYERKKNQARTTLEQVKSTGYKNTVSEMKSYFPAQQMWPTPSAATVTINKSSDAEVEVMLQQDGVARTGL